MFFKGRLLKERDQVDFIFIESFQVLPDAIVLERSKKLSVYVRLT